MNILSTTGRPIGRSALSDPILESYEVSICQATAFRRGLIAELCSIGHKLHNIQTGGHLTQELTIWHREFRAALNTNLDVRPIFDRFVELLQDILVDSITQAPLDSEAFLGSDGHCYGMKTLCVFENSLKDAYRFRSPLNFQDPDQEEFFVVPHELARHMVKWLENQDKQCRGLPEIEEAYENLVSEVGINRVKRLIPTKRNNRIRRIHQEAELKNLHQVATQEMKGSLASLEGEVKAEIKKEFRELAKKVDQSAKEVLARLDHIERVQNAAYLEVDRRITQLENEQQVTQNAIEELENKISHVNHEIEDAKKEQLQVEVSIKKVEAAIEKRKKNRIKHLMGTIAVIGSCMLGTVLIQQVFPSMSILPENGGNGLSFIFKLKV